MRYLRDWRLSALVLGLMVPCTVGAAGAQEEPLSVTYGSDASAAEGDFDYREVIYFKVPASLADRLHLRIFDADVGGEHDLIYGTGEDTETRFTLFGGVGASTIPSPGDEASVGELRAGDVIVERVLGSSAALDDRWQTLASFRPDQGELVDDHYLFRLLVEGVAGNDGNLFSPTLSLRERRNLKPSGLEIFAFSPTVRVPDDRRITELRFRVPADAERVVVRNFDAANGQLSFASTYRSLPLTASGQNEWREDEVPLEPMERGATAAVLLGGGEEIPNDVTVAVTDGAGQALPIELPVRASLPNGRPIPAADVALLGSCFTVAFDASASRDPDGHELTYLWEFGDGATDTGRAVVHRYPGPGDYRALLRVVDSSGQVASGAVQSHDISVKHPPNANAGPDVVVAPGVAVDFDGTSSEPGDRPIARYLWDFQDGGTAEGPTPIHLFETPGRYLVTLTVEDDSIGPCNFNTDQRLVQVNAAPVAVAGSEQRASVGQVVTLDGRRSYDVDGEVASYDWDLGDDTRASGPVAEHAYSEPGTYAVTLTVRDDSGVANQLGSDAAYIMVNEPPIAVAGPDRLVAIGEVIDFDASASTDPDGSIVAYQWNFGDGSRGSGAHVPYAYRQSGTYRVTLTVRDDSGTDSSRTSDQLTVVVNEPPVADAGDDQLVTSSEVQFDGSGSSDPDGTIARYEWDFGDGAQRAGRTPRHVYQKPGRYLVRLTVTDDSGTMRNSASDSVLVTINEAPIADAGPDLIAAPGQKVTLAASGSIDPDGDLTEFNWDFKDGDAASGERVEHSFERPGTYRVRLSVRDDTGQPDAIDFDEAKVIVNAPPVAKAGPSLLAAPGDALQFDGTHSFDLDGSIVSYRWDFSDRDEPQFGPQVVRAYAAPGIYTARLTVIDDSGAINATAQDEVVIRINDAPVAEAGADITTSSATVSFDASQSADANGDALTYRWDFGDGSPPESGVRVTHIYADGGSYPVVLTVDDGTGLRNATDATSVTVVIDRPPVADAGGNKDVCAGDIVVFDGTGSSDPESGLLRYQWDFGDGTGSDIVNPTKVYEKGAVYPVTLTVQDESGFATNRHTDRIAVRADESPIAAAGPDQTVCVGTEVHFDGSGSRDFDGVVNRFSWNFGDGTVGGGERPVHVYDQPGEYRVLLTIEGEQAGQCDNTNSDEIMVKAVEAPVARIAAPASAPIGQPVTFDASRSSSGPGRIVAWRWDFGDGSTATGPVVEQTFEKAGPHFVTLAIWAEGGSTSCSAVTTQHAIVINEAPIADPGEAQLVGVGQEVLFDASGSHDPDGELVSYQWDFGDGTTASGVNVWHRFRTAGRFPVTLVVTDDTDLPNNSTSSTIAVEVNHAPVAVIDSPPVACTGEVLKFNAAGSSDADGEIVDYAWAFGDRGTAEGAETTHRYEAPGFYDLGLTVDDGRGLNNSRQQATQRFHVNRPPRAEAGPDRMACPGEPITFDASASSDWDGELESYRWDFGDGTSTDGVAVEHVFDQPGVYRVRLWVTDDSGSACAAASDVVRVVVNGPPVADAGGDRKGFVGGAHDQLLFDASASRDDDGQPLSYLWDFGDGVTVAGEKVLHAYDEPGVYPVRLSVSDGSGLACGQASDAASVAVQRRE